MSSGNGVQSIGPVGAGIVLINARAAERAEGQGPSVGLGLSASCVRVSVGFAFA